MVLSWDAEVGASSYTVAEGQGTVCSTASTSCTVQGLTNGTSYDFTVRAVGAGKASAPSAPVTATPESAPATPTNVLVSPGASQVALAWTAPSVAPSQQPLTYNIYESAGSSYVVAATGVTGPSYTVGGLAPGTTYGFEVSAVDSYGQISPPSPAVYATPSAYAAQVVSAGPVAYLQMDEPAGTATLTDLSGSGHNGQVAAGTSLGAPSGPASVSSTSAAFKTTSGGVNLAGSASMNEYPLTVQAWVDLPSSLPLGNAGLVNKYAASSLDGWQVFEDPQGEPCAYYFASASAYIGDSGSGICSPVALNGTGWAMVSLVVSPTGATLYVDGTAEATAGWTGTPGAPTTSQPVQLGVYPASTVPFSTADIAQVALYPSALGSSQVQAQYAAAQGIGAPTAYVGDSQGYDATLTPPTATAFTDNVTLPSDSYATAITPDGRYGYVVNGDKIYKFSTATRTLVGQPVAVGSWPQGIALTPDGKQLFVADYGSSDVYVIGTTTGAETVVPLPVGTKPTQVVVTPDGKDAYFSDTGPGSSPGYVSEVSTATDAVVATVQVQDGPGGIAVSPDGKTLYVANFDSGTISVIDTATNTVVSTINAPGGDEPWGLAVSPAGDRLYVTEANASSVSVIDTSTDTITGTIDLGPDTWPLGLAVTKDGKYLDVANDWKPVSVITISTATGTVVSTAEGAPGTSPDINFVTISGPPAAPAGLSATVGNSQVQIDWDSVYGATAYELYEDGQLVYSGAATDDIISGLAGGTSYSFYVVATGPSGVSVPSPSISVAPA